ncbi:hypothetical protein [Photorhabdus australis]|uniref:hypothetical protein n=1 Tax=Photorhabdus australis TaxID=286156 RepID=UPI00068D9E87|nr:hypothetical protein [Photorhabdus australis]
MNHYLSSKMTVKEFNKKYPIGSEFYYSSLIDKDNIRHVVTRSAAWKLGHGNIVVSFEGMTGGVSITHLEPVMVNVQVEVLAGVTTLEGNRYLNQLREEGIIKSRGFIVLNSIRSRQQRGRMNDE